MKRHLPIIIISAFVILMSGVSLSYASSAKSIASSPPRSVSVKQTGDSLVITWKKPLQRFDGYIIYRSNFSKNSGNAIWRTADPNIRTSFTDSSVQSNTKYYYTVRSFITIHGNPTTEVESTNKTQVSKLVKIPRKVVVPVQPPSPPAAPSVSAKDEKSVAIVFLYINEPMPTELISRLTDKSWYKEGELQNAFNNCSDATHCFSNNFFFAKDWWEREAKKYNKDFNFDIVTFSTQIKLKSNEYTYEEGGANSFELEIGYEEIRRALKTRITELIPDIKKYSRVNFVIYGSDIGAGTNAYFGLQTDPQFSALLFVDHIFHKGITDITQDFTEQFSQFRTQEEQLFLASWLHELFHSFGAIDKYISTAVPQACKTNPATGGEYDYRDLFCHRIPTVNGGMAGFTNLNDLNQLIISEPTAKEIGWK